MSGSAPRRRSAGPCNTPTAERLAAGGLKLTRFHTTALCSPTRAGAADRPQPPLGRAWARITEMATSAPGNSSVRPKDKAPLAETLKLNGYSTAQFGKCHEVPAWEVTPVGAVPPVADRFGLRVLLRLRRRRGQPVLPGPVRGHHGGRAARRHPEEGYTLTEDLADRAITWVRQQKALTPDKPFFMYFAPGATHAPHHVPKEWSDKYKGKFDDGWDALREKIFAAAEEAGRHPEGRRADQAARGDPGLGRHARRAEAGAGAADGDLRRLPGADRPRGRAA